MIYLASPYTHKDPFVREDRYLRAMQALKHLLLSGTWAYSPIVHCHELAKIADLPREAGFWRRYNFGMLACCKGIIILRIDGWQESVGVAEELAEARRLEIPEEYL